MSAEHPSADILRTAEAGARVIRGGVLRGSGYAVGLLLGAATSVFLLRGLGVDDFGRFATVAALIGIVSTVTDAGLTAIGARELALRPRGSDRDELLSLLVALRVGLTAVGVLLAVVFAWSVGYDTTMLWGTLLAGLGVLLLNTQSTAMIPLSVELRLRAITAVDIARQALTLAGVALLALAGASLLPYFAVQIGVGLCVLAVTPALVGSARALRPRLDRAEAGRLLRESLPVAVAIALNVLYLRLLVIIVSLLESETETGLYATSFRVFEMLLGAPAIVLAVALPVLAVAGAEDLDRLRYGVQRMTEVAFVVGLGVALATTAFAAPAIRLLFGEQYDGAAPMLRIQAWALVALFLGQVLSLALLALRLQRAIAIANTIAVAFVLVLGFALTSRFAGEGAAVAGVVTEAVLMAALYVFLAQAGSGTAPRLSFAWRGLVALAAGVVPLLVLGVDSWLAAGLSLGAFVVVALVARAMPYEVLEALRGRAPGDRP